MQFQSAVCVLFAIDRIFPEIDQCGCATLVPCTCPAMHFSRWRRGEKGRWRERWCPAVDYPLLTDGHRLVQPAWLVSALFAHRDSAGEQIFYKRASNWHGPDSHFRGSAGISRRLTVTCAADFATAANFILFEVLVLNPRYITVEDVTLSRFINCSFFSTESFLELRYIVKEYHSLYFLLQFFLILFFSFNCSCNQFPYFVFQFFVYYILCFWYNSLISGVKNVITNIFTLVKLCFCHTADPRRSYNWPFSVNESLIKITSQRNTLFGAQYVFRITIFGQQQES